jgi:hypothetical protein
VRFLGRSVIASPYGRPIAGPLSPDGEAIAVAEIDTDEPARAQVRGGGISPRSDRRTDVYTLEAVAPKTRAGGDAARIGARATTLAAARGFAQAAETHARDPPGERSAPVPVARAGMVGAQPSAPGAEHALAQRVLLVLLAEHSSLAEDREHVLDEIDD